MEEANIYNLPEYKRSRKAYTLQCAFEYFVAILVGDAFLAKLLTAIGISDSLIGIISSFISFAFLFQLFTVVMVTKIKNVKRMTMFFSTLSQVLFGCLYLIPFLAVDIRFRTVAVVFCVLAAYFGNYFVTSMIYNWGNSFAEPSKRAEFSANKEIVSLLSGMVFTFAVGWIIDKFEVMGNINGGFLFSACAIFILSICNFISLMTIKSRSNEACKENVSLKESIGHTVGNKNFLKVIIMSSLWDISRYMSLGFMGTFKTKDLMFSLVAVQVINIMGSIARALISKPFGKFSDKHTYELGMKVGFVIAAVGYLFNIFATRGSRWCVIIYTVLFNASLAGTNQNNLMLSYNYVDKKYVTQAMAIKNSISGMLGFLASIVGGKILAMVQANGNSFFGIPMYGQQLLSAVSLAVVVADIVFVTLKIENKGRKVGKITQNGRSECV